MLFYIINFIYFIFVIYIIIINTIISKIRIIIVTYLLKLATNFNNGAAVDACRSEMEGETEELVI